MPADGRGPVLSGTRGAAVTWLAIGLWTAGWGWSRLASSGVSWHFSVDGARALFGGTGLHLYAQHPDLQIGPLGLVVSKTGVSTTAT